MKLPDPDYHSIIAHKDTGLAITVFDWAVKKFSEYGVDDGFVAKFYAAVDAVIGHGENNDNKYENRYLFTPNVK
ncbi:MAG TPA: hypothetical protein PKD18_02865 [Saprospiraceae bacterium]|nr:hypothetical protein [Saprospiraceae bacterium]